MSEQNEKKKERFIAEVGLTEYGARVPRLTPGTVLVAKRGVEGALRRPGKIVDGIRATPRGIEVLDGDDVLVLGPAMWTYLVERTAE